MIPSPTGNRDFSLQGYLSSLDYVYADAMTLSAPNGATTLFPKSIKSKIAALIIVAQGPVQVQLFNAGTGGFAAAQAIAVPAGSVGPIGIEVDNDFTPAVNNPGAGAVLVTIIMLRRRRTLEVLPGQV